MPCKHCRGPLLFTRSPRVWVCAWCDALMPARTEQPPSRFSGLSRLARFGLAPRDEPLLQAKEPDS